MTAVPEMIEKVARALAEVSDDCRPWGEVPSYRKVEFRMKARVAIAAMREPNEAMRYAVWYDQYMTCGGPAEVADELARKKVADEVQKQQDLSSFSALIDAALGNPQVAE